MEINAQAHIETIMKSGQGLIELLSTGKGLNLTPEQQEQFKKAMKDSGSEKAVEDLKQKMADIQKQYAEKMGGNNTPGI